MLEQVGQAGRCALVLGGGGPLGVAWEAGLLQGWAQGWQQFVQQEGTAGSSGSAVSRDSRYSASALALFLEGRIIGTSAGAIVGAHLAVHDSIEPLVAQQSQSLGDDTPRGPGMTKFLAAFFKAKLFTRSMPSLRRSLGRSARRMALPGEAGFVAAIARSYAPKGGWPAGRELLVTVVDAESGELHAWTSESGVPLALAVTASCAVPCAFPLVHVNGRSYMDGGVGSSTNTALARGCDRVLILDPLGRMFGGSPLDAERRALEAEGSRTLAFLPDQAVAAAIGRNFLDTTRRAQVCELARAQGLSTAHGVWNFLRGSGISRVPAAAASHS